jgi:hypothetical protein
MPNRSAQFLLTALSRAVAEPAGLPLLASRSQPGFFASTSAGRQAAQHCQDQGFLQLVATEPPGQSSPALYQITEKGLQHLLSNAPPKQLLQDFLRVLEARQTQAADLVTAARQMQASLEGLHGSISRLMAGVETPAPPPPSDPETWALLCLEGLGRWRGAGDCPLPELFRLVTANHPLTIGQFHDGLRRLHETTRIYVHPWGGPLYDLPEPQFAVLIGHLVAYYASVRG